MNPQKELLWGLWVVTLLHKLASSRLTHSASGFFGAFHKHPRKLSGLGFRGLGLWV